MEMVSRCCVTKAGAAFLPVDRPARRAPARMWSVPPPPRPHHLRSRRDLEDGGDGRRADAMAARSRLRPTPTFGSTWTETPPSDLHLGSTGAEGRRGSAPGDRQPGGRAARGVRRRAGRARAAVRLLLLRRGRCGGGAHAAQWRHAGDGAPRAGRPRAAGADARQGGHRRHAAPLAPRHSPAGRACRRWRTVVSARRGRLRRRGGRWVRGGGS